MSREAYGGGGQYGGGSSSNNSGGNNNGGGGDGNTARERARQEAQQRAQQQATQRAREAEEKFQSTRPTMADVTGDTLPESFGAVDPDPEVGTPTQEREDTITKFSKNLEANVKANPLLAALTPISTLIKTGIQTQAANSLLGNITYGGTGSDGDDGITLGGADGRGSERELRNALTPLAPYVMSGTISPESMVLSYFSQPSNLQTRYNNAKSNLNSLFNITPISQQYGYVGQPNLLDLDLTGLI